jgi:opacity protein-like surface antigen
MAVSQNLTARLDYSYQDYGTFTLGGPGPVGGTTVNVNSHTLMAGIAYKF